MKLGKKPFVPDPRDLKFSKYRMRLVEPELPPVPEGPFGHEELVPAWGMLANDSVGCCVFAGAAHETMLWTREGQQPADFTDATVLADYSAVTGYDPSDPSTDAGTDVREALKYRRNVGILDAQGNRHKIGAFVGLDVGNVDHVLEALYLFGAVALGIQIPDTAMEEFKNGRPWDLPGGSIEGGHYVPLVARRENLVVVTWAKLQQMTAAFYAQFSDEAWGILSEEMLVGGRSPEGFDLEALKADLVAVSS